ncbi:hypothetical protein ACP6EK_01685 [Candidatus Caldatribacterium sp. SIUC1]|uniref:hypothetical protein n=1 Tax=Candidatus Caldatribacterium sp. SIUC1 TaxID=3418365 RepID=UPI003F68FF42
MVRKDREGISLLRNLERLSCHFAAWKDRKGNSDAGTRKSGQAGEEGFEKDWQRGFGIKNTELKRSLHGDQAKTHPAITRSP